MPKKSFSPNIKLLALQYLEQGYTLQKVCTMFSVTTKNLQVWRAIYKHGGVEALVRPVKNKVYSKDLKQHAVEDYLSGNYSQFDILAKYGISSLSVFNTWLKIYTSHSELKDSGKGMSKTMTKGRKTTVEERIEIAKACLANEKNYQEMAAKYEVSYQQVYQWVRKFEDGGEEALQDRRGRLKPIEERTPEDELRLKIQQMERENERLRAENLLLKKLEEI
ncbi:MAG TPA: helix-turn-helix domain-containing protein, partial [Niallia sp.]|nr:helix-turn-helix domain-containing protein [Niallia sp.]